MIRIDWYPPRWFPSFRKWAFSTWNHTWLVGVSILGLTIEWETPRFV